MPPGMSGLTPGQRLGAYEILAAVGAGGMGEVYRARDVRLGREVAVKVLPAELADDSERLARFRREAQLLAALSHPGIAAIHGLEEADGRPFLVLELVPGEDLGQRLRRGALPVDEALALARQIAEAIEEAHERGIVHRDLKPANVKVTPDGRAKVLDFGLAKAFVRDVEQDPTGPLAGGATVTSDGTAAGVILGTAAYMSPEQARGRPVDRRTDIWAFGVMLFETLTGERLFAGETLSDTLAAVLQGPIDLGRLPPATPPAARQLIARCLERDAKRRLRDIGEARVALSPETSSTSLATTAPAVRQPAHPLRASSGRVAVAALALAAGTVLGFALRQPPRTTPARPARFTVDLPEGVRLIASPYSRVSLSADGRRLAFAARSPRDTAIYTREVDGFGVREVPGSSGGMIPALSPDGTWVAFCVGSTLRKAPVDGGAASTIAALSFWPWSIAWLDDQQLLVEGRTQGLWTLRRDPVAGERPVALTTVDAKAGEQAHRDPVPLPGGRVLYRIEGRQTSFAIAVAGRPPVAAAIPADRIDAYVEGGGLVARQAGQLVILPFDVEAGAISGPARAIETDFKAEQVAVASAGALAYQELPRGLARRLVFVDRAGRGTPVVADEDAYRWPAVSPDGRRLAFGTEGSGDIWVLDLTTGSRTRLLDPGDNTEPVWSADGRRVIYSSNQGQGFDLFTQAASSSSTDSLRLLGAPGIDEFATDVSPDGRALLLYGGGEGVEPALFVADLAPPGPPRPLVTRGGARGGRFSPDGRFVAYEADDSGRSEVYVVSFPPGEARWPVSPDGGAEPVWSADGRELFYRTGDKLMTVAVSTAAGFTAQPPKLLFERPYESDISGDASYDIAPDGRFVMLQVEAAAQPRLRVRTGLALRGDR